MNNILKIPAFQRKKAIPKQLKDLELLPLNEEFSKLTMPIVSDDDLRPVMMGNYFDLEKRKIASTDAHKLIAINMPNETFNYISNNYKEELQKEPKGLIFHTISQLQKDYNDLVKLAYKNNSTDFQSFNEFVKFRAIQDGRYPNYEAVTPKEFIAEINVDYQKLYWYAKVLVDAKVIDDINKIDSGNYYVYQNKKIEYLKDSYVSFLNPVTKQIILTYTLDGKKEYIGFNARLLCEILKFAMELNGKYFGKVGVNATGKAMVIELENGLNISTDSIGLIMPVILNRGESTNTIGNDGSPLDEMKTYEMYYDLDTNSIISDKENYPIDSSIGFMPNKVGSTQKMTSQQGKMEKHYEMVRKVQAERESKVENNSEDLIDKKIRGLRIALKVAIKGEEKLIEKRILALEIAKKMSSPKFSVSEKMSNLDNNKIKDWYIKNYPADDLKNKLDDKNTFEDLWNGLGKNKDIYEIIGIGDSIIRERLFEHLAELKGVTYNVVYNKWLDKSEDIGSELNKSQLSKIRNQYYLYGDNNYHSENVLLLAKNFGTNNDIDDAKQIIKKHDEDGYLTSENSEKRRELSQKLIEKAKKIMSEKGVKFVRGGSVDRKIYIAFYDDYEKSYGYVIEKNANSNILYWNGEKFTEKYDAKTYKTKSIAERELKNIKNKANRMEVGGRVGNSEIEIATLYGKMLNQLGKEKQFNKKFEKKVELDKFSKSNGITIDNNNIISINGVRVAFIDKINQKTGQEKSNWEIKKFNNGGSVDGGDYVREELNFSDSMEYAKGGYTRPSYKINTTGFFSFKTKDKEYIVRSSFFERKNDIEDSLQIQDELRGELGSIIITNSAWKRLSDGNTIKARSNKGNLTGTLTRVANLNENYSLNKMANGGNVSSIGSYTDFKNKVVITANKRQNDNSYEVIVKRYPSGENIVEYPRTMNRVVFAKNYIDAIGKYTDGEIGIGTFTEWIKANSLDYNNLFDYAEKNNVIMPKYYAKGGNVSSIDKVRERVNDFLNPLGYSAKVEESIGSTLYTIEPNTRKVGNNRSDFFDGMQIIAENDGTFEVSEYMAGKNENELHIYLVTKSLTLALKDLIKGNKRKPIKKYFKTGGMIGFTNDPIYSKGNISVQRIGGSSMWNVAINKKSVGRVLNAFTKEQAFSKAQKEKFANGGMVEFHDYKGIEIMYEPNEKEYYANDMVFYSLEDAQEYIDSGEANKTPKHIENLYRRGAMAKGGNVVSQDLYKLAEEMSEKDFRNKFLTLSKSEKDNVESLIRLGDDKKLALITILDKRDEPNNDDFYRQAYHYKGGGDVEDEKVYIDYMNKEKGFKRDRIYFDSYAEAVEWGKKNFERFNTDMINYV